MELAAHRILFGEENQQNPKNPWVYPCNFGDYTIKGNNVISNQQVYQNISKL
jgi:hypothetical protein